MPVTEKGYGFATRNELEPTPIVVPGATDETRRRLDVRRRFGITSFGVQAFEAQSGAVVINEHDEMQQWGQDGQEELYIVLSGAATFEIDGDSVEAPAGSFVYVQPTGKRKATATQEGTTILVVGGTPGKPYDPAPDEVAEAFTAYNAGDHATALAKQLVVVEKRPNDPVAHFNAGCFAARAGRTDEAIEHLRRAVETNERIKELIASDEDLGSIRNDPRFAQLAE